MHARCSTRPVRALAALLLAAGLALAGCGGPGDGDAGSSGDRAAVGEAGAKKDAQGYAHGGAEGGAKEGAPGSGAADDAGASAAPKAPANPNRVIRTASVSVRVEDVPKALDEARATAENAGGHVGSETTTADEEGREHTRVVLRVPVDRYEAVLADLEGTGRLLERTARAQDVTDQVVDVESRIASQRASVARIRELMDRATKLSDVVTLEGELSTRQADLESLLARQASLEDRTSLATVTLSLSERPGREAARDDGPGFVDALAGGWDAFVTMLRWLMVALGAVLPFAAAAALLVLGWLKLVGPRLPHRPKPAPAATALGPLPPARPAPGRARAESPDEGAAQQED